MFSFLNRFIVLLNTRWEQDLAPSSLLGLVASDSLSLFSLRFFINRLGDLPFRLWCYKRILV